MATTTESRRRSAPETRDEFVIPSQSRRRLSADVPAPADTFHTVLESVGCPLRSSGPPLLSCDYRSAAQELERKLKSRADLTVKFLECFHGFAADEANFRRMLQPMLVMSKAGGMRSCESLSRMLLSVGQTQSNVAIFLLEKIPEHIGDAEANGPEALPSMVDSIPRVILSQFRWLEFLVDSRKLTEKLLEVLSICPVGLKKEMITFLPEVIVDADHEMVVQSLEEMLQDDLQLIVPILDAFSNLNLEENLFQRVVTLALASLRSADAEDLPLVVKFLLQSANGANVKQVVQQLRENLHFMTIADVRAVQPDRKMKGKSTATNCEVLVLETIRSGVRFQNLILEAALKEIRTIEGAKNHKVVDVLLLLIIHANGGPHRKTAEQLFLKKIAVQDINTLLLRQCIQNRGDSLQDYFQTLISISEMCLRSKDLTLRQFGKSSYELLFQEFAESYYRQEVLGALISHTGSGNPPEIGSALETLFLLATKHIDDLLPISSFINGVLDHLEVFRDSHLHQVYRIFGHLAVTAWTSRGVSSGSSVGNELLIIIRKQITNAESTYRRMGIIGSVELASCLERVGSNADDNPQMSDIIEELLSLHQLILESCESSPHAIGFFYDELISQIENASLGTSFLTWISKHVSEFEATYLGDLDGGQLQTAHDFGDLEGELWMNLDDDMSPIVLDILPMLMKEDKSFRMRLNFLPAKFRLLAAMERLKNGNSLGGIDALLGCPMLLPKLQILSGESWRSLKSHLKDTGCLALFYAINWIRELISAFSTQIDASVESQLPQSSREETIGKLLKRVRNLMFLEHCLGRCLELTNVIFDPLYFVGDASARLQLEQNPHGATRTVQKPRQEKGGKRGRPRKVSSTDAPSKKPSDNSSQDAPKTSQQTIIDALNKANGSVQNSTPVSQRCAQNGCDAAQPSSHKATISLGFNEQRWKLRPLTISSLQILGASQNTVKSCCADPHAELPVLLYLLQDLQLKLDECLEGPPRRMAPWMKNITAPKVPSGLGSMSGIELLSRLQPLFPNLRKHLDCAVLVIQSDASHSQQECENRPCDEHWSEESISAGNPHDDTFSASSKECAESLLLVVIRCLGKVISYPDLQVDRNATLLNTILVAFHVKDDVRPTLVPPLVPRSQDDSFCTAYKYLANLSAAAVAVSFTAATELFMVLKALVNCYMRSTDTENGGNRRRISSVDGSSGAAHYLRCSLSQSAGEVLRQDWHPDNWKSKADVLHQLIQMHIQNSESSIELLDELVFSTMSQVPPKGNRANHESTSNYPALCAGTFIVWYRVAHEEVLDLMVHVIKDFLASSKSDASTDSLLNRAQHSITLHVSLVNFTKTHQKDSIHATAVRFGGKFVDTFLRGMDFLKSHYGAHKNSIDDLMKELQKATRIIQTLCSEAKGQKRMPVTCKVPMVKRSMERFVYCVKALLHSTSHGSSFWMGNLKHKDLHGREISSQPYAGDDNEDPEEENEEDQENSGEDGSRNGEVSSEEHEP